MNFLQEAKEFLESADSYGFVIVSSGVYVQSADYIISDQEDWADEDANKDKDFSTHKYWLTTDGEQEPRGFDRPEQLANFLAYIEGEEYDALELPW